MTHHSIAYNTLKLNGIQWIVFNIKIYNTKRHGIEQIMKSHTAHLLSEQSCKFLSFNIMNQVLISDNENILLFGSSPHENLQHIYDQ